MAKIPRISVLDFIDTTKKGLEFLYHNNDCSVFQNCMFHLYQNTNMVFTVSHTDALVFQKGGRIIGFVLHTISFKESDT